MKKNNILLIGRNGQLGRAVVKFSNYLDSSIYNLYSIGREVLDLENALEEDYIGIFEEFNPDIVINAAAFTNVDAAESEMDAAIKINGTSLKLICEQCKKREIPLVHFSTDYVFDGSGNIPWGADFRVNPLSVYGKSKVIGEKLIKQSGIKFIIFRISWLFGQYGNNFVKTMLNLSQRRQLKIVDDQFGGPTSAESVAFHIIKLIPLIISNKSPNIELSQFFPWGIYHFQGLPIVSRFQFAEIIFQKAIALKKLEKFPELIPVRSKEFNTPAQRPLNSRLDCYATEEKLGILQPKWDRDLYYYIRSFKSD